MVVRAARWGPGTKRRGIGERGARQGVERRHCCGRCRCRMRRGARGGGFGRSNRGVRIVSHGRPRARLAGGGRIAAARRASRIYFAVMDRRVKERLIGASILVALVVLVVPELLSAPKPSAPTMMTLPASAPGPARIVTLYLAICKAPASTESDTTGTQGSA